MSFLLDRPKATTPTFIFFRKMINGEELKYPTNAKVDPDNWDRKLKRLTVDRGRVNVLLEKINTVYQDASLQAKLAGRKLTKLEVEKALDKALGREKETRSSFYEAIDQIIADRESGKVVTRTGKKFSPLTIKGYRHTRDYLIKFDPNMRFEAITLKTYESLINYLNTERNHSLNAAGKIVKNWKVFLKAAFKAGLHNNLIFEHEDFRVPEEETDDIYLTDIELKSIYECKFENKGLDQARDWFIIDCFTGLRVSDIKVLQVDNIAGDFIDLANEKTDIHVTIPKHSYVKQILQKWNGLPPRVTEQAMNRSLKDIAKAGGVKGKILYSITKGGVRVDEFIERWKMVSNHTARRSFISNLLEQGVQDNIVMQLAGIKKHSTLLRYKKTKPQKTAEIMAEHPFFK